MRIRYGGPEAEAFELVDNDNLVVVRTLSRAATRRAAIASPARDRFRRLHQVVAFPVAGVEVYATGEESAAEVRTELQQDPALQFAGRCLADPNSGAPVVYTENAFVQFFEDDIETERAQVIAAEYGLRVSRSVTYAPGAFVLKGPEGIGRGVFEAAEGLLDSGLVRLCHPELARERSLRYDPLQWHLDETVIDGTAVDAHVRARDAWSASQGDQVTIAVIDDGFDTDHVEFALPGKVVAPRDATFDSSDPRPSGRDDHGTACAGVACASGTGRASGVAPRARLMPIRLASGLGSQQEAEAFAWAADNGADIISCSWGPVDGEWWNPDDPQHRQLTPLPDSSRLAIEYALTRGRGGRGCVITWAAGNGNESVDLDGYASHPGVMAVAACNDRSTRSVYSDMGDAIWCAFPSGDADPGGGPVPLTNGIFTTDRTGVPGYNAGANPVDATGDYTDDFGGTSSACPGVAGVAALVLAVNSDLATGEVKELIKNSCDRIDEASGTYGADGHSHWYGYGRVNALRAVELAAEAAGSPGASAFGARFNEPIPDTGIGSVAVQVADPRTVASIRLQIDIDHTWVGDLAIDVVPPGRPRFRVWTGTGPDNRRTLRLSLSDGDLPALGGMIGTAVNGEWRLIVDDRVARDTGVIRGFEVVITPQNAGGGGAVVVTPPDTDTDTDTDDDAPGPRVRRDVWDLADEANPWDPTLEAYAHAVGVMMSRASTEPISWAYQGAIHGTNGPARPLTDQCQHNSWFFLPWHRMYLYRFEQIVREIVIDNGGPEDWALPFWDYTRAPQTAALPPAFREPMKDGVANPLFVASRWQDRNDGVPMNGATVNTGPALGTVTFSGVPSDPNDPGFGGPETGWNHGGGPVGVLEALPHGTVHMRVGGLMTAFETAALDPIFWLHHANIDRLWEVWLNQPGRQNPTQQVWHDFSFDLFDVNGQQQSMQVADTLDSGIQLGYVYQGVAPPPRDQSHPAPAPRRLAMPDDLPAELVGVSEEGVVLSQGETRAAIPISVAPRRRSVAGPDDEPPRPSRVLLAIDDLRVAPGTVPGMPYEVIVDMGLEGEVDDHVVGVVSLFGFAEARDTSRAQMPHDLRYSFDITAVHDRLREAGLWDDRELRVMFRPVEEPSPEEELVDVEIGRIAVYYG